MPTRLNIIGNRYGRLVVTSEAEPYTAPCGVQYRRLNATCDCGSETKTGLRDLTSGNTTSCGCYRIEKKKITRYVHGDARVKAHAREYICWVAMIQRCEGKNNKHYMDYGGRGISVCPRWRHGDCGKTGYECFLADMGRKPSPKHMLDRKDNDGPYSPENCQWATPTQQARNRRSNRLVTYQGETMPLVTLAEKFGMSQKLLGQRLRNGWSLSRALSDYKSAISAVQC